jgi:hypothetical protein
MANRAQLALLKRLLIAEVSAFCKRDDRLWKQPIWMTVKEIREQNWEAVFFGGTLRSLLLSRLAHRTPGRPRDVDIVMECADMSALKRKFGNYIARETRFGGLQLRRRDWHFDVWPLRDTSAFRDDEHASPRFDDLPSTTFFNIEAIAVDVWPQRGRPRRVFSGDDQFFEAILTRTLEINRERNPYPELCVVRSLVLAHNLQWRIGPRLVRYLASHGSVMSSKDFEAVQKQHYGAVLWSANVFDKSMRRIMLAADRHYGSPIDLPFMKQLSFWPDEDQVVRRINLWVMNAADAEANSLVETTPRSTDD